MNKGIIYGKNLDLYIHKKLFIKSNLFKISNMYSTHFLDYIKNNSKMNNFYCVNDIIIYKQNLLNYDFTDIYYRLSFNNKLAYYDNLINMNLYNIKKFNYNFIIDVYNDNNDFISLIKVNHNIYKT
jgi:hypothetical protein